MTSIYYSIQRDSIFDTKYYQITVETFCQYYRFRANPMDIKNDLNSLDPPITIHAKVPNWYIWTNYEHMQIDCLLCMKSYYRNKNPRTRIGHSGWWLKDWM